MIVHNESLGSELHEVIGRLKHLASSKQVLGELKDLLSANIQQENQLMSQITDWAAQEQADLTAISNTLDAVVAGVATLDKMIADFQNSPGTMSAADQTALDNLQAFSKTVVAKASAISVAPPVPPSPPVVG
jgi:hypothetical protein